MSKSLHDFKHKKVIKCKKRGKGTEDEPYEPELPPEILSLIPANPELEKTHFIMRVVKENPDGTLEVEIYHD
jgi:hypothetical protein